MSLNTTSSSLFPERALLILVELEHGSLPAATLKRKMEQAYALPIEPGAFYKVLTRLERKGWIELADTALHPHSYGLTERGQAALHQHRDLVSQRRERIPTTARNTSLRGGIMKLAIWIVKLYPRKWRERYEIEMLALLEDHPITLLTVFDLLFGVLDARLDPHYRTGQALSAFKRPHTATLIFFAAFALFLAFMQGSTPFIMQGAVTLLGSWQGNGTLIAQIIAFMTEVIYGTTNGSFVSQTIELMLEGFFYGLLCLSTMLVAFAPMRRIIAGRHIGTALFAVACFALPIIPMLLPHISVSTYFFQLRRYEPFALWMGMESLMGMLFLTVLKVRQAIATRRKRLLFFVILIDALLVLRGASVLSVWSLNLASNPYLLNPLSMLTSLTTLLFPFTTIGMLLLALAGSKFGEWTKRFAFVITGLTTLIMLVNLLFFLVGGWHFWMYSIGTGMTSGPVPGIFFSRLPIVVISVGLLFSTLLALAAFCSLLLASNRASVTKAAIQELPPLEMRQ